MTNPLTARIKLGRGKRLHLMKIKCDFLPFQPSRFPCHVSTQPQGKNHTTTRMLNTDDGPEITLYQGHFPTFHHSLHISVGQAGLQVVTSTIENQADLCPGISPAAVPLTLAFLQRDSQSPCAWVLTEQGFSTRSKESIFAFPLCFFSLPDMNTAGPTLRISWERCEAGA